ncbi:efflux transporter outer membrane subunit [Caenimonas koreensis DSM 17982]|uniref:Efflux transporter outer membrane subunit n=1 Tax=Caenimonas koreensis DSM 17982 TaxID=1121255 RepID=A0A844AU59_9BURK|nr:efflux transporter outer membrane subunit [Caenimonas koreensis]MRD47885.1 efflux transporter outer membrane subunit [Caenimonas koreensis DSM 17982]
MIWLFRRAPLGALAAALWLAGCASYQGINASSTFTSPQAMGIPGTAAKFETTTDWWKQFGDEQLDKLIAQALEGNPNLKIARARLARAQAVTEVADAATLPQVNGSLDATRQKYSANGLFPPPIAGSTRDSGTLQLNVNWELDFFGKHQAALDSALSAAQAAQADAQAARIMLAANVARSYFQLARINDQLAVARRTLAQRAESLKLVQDRVNAGLDTNLELRQSEGSLPEARQQLEALQEQAVMAQNAIAALTAQGNRQPIATQPTLAGFKPAATPRELPADLLAQRADITAARWRVEAAGKDVVNAKAQFYPNINIVAFAGLNSLGLGRLLNTGSEQWGVGPAVRLPIFDAGRLRANLRGKTADLDVAIESYNAAVLDAIHETADQIASSQSIARQQAEQRDAQAAAEGAYDIAVQRYKVGLGTYLNVLAAETSVLSQRRLGVDLAARALDTQVQLIRAAGGGYRADASAASVAAR